MKIAITGGAGFIGSQLGHAFLRQGDEVIVIDDFSSGRIDNIIHNGHVSGEVVIKDIRSPELYRSFAGVDVVFHLAGIAALPVCQADPLAAYSINTAGTANVLEAARRVGVRRLVFSSTSAVYENSEPGVFAEDTPVRPDLVYAMTKDSAERLCTSFAKTYEFDVVIARFFNVYGPHQDVRRKSPPFTSYIAKELACGRAPVLYNNTSARRDYVYSADVVSLLIKMAACQQKFRGEIFNISSGKGYSVPEIVALMSEISGRSLPAIYRDPQTIWDAYSELFSGKFPLDRRRIQKEVHKESIGDSTKAAKAFRWRSETGIREGLESVYRFAESQRNLW